MLGRKFSKVNFHDLKQIIERYSMTDIPQVGKEVLVPLGASVLSLILAHVALIFGFNETTWLFLAFSATAFLVLTFTIFEVFEHLTVTRLGIAGLLFSSGLVLGSFEYLGVGIFTTIVGGGIVLYLLIVD